MDRAGIVEVLDRSQGAVFRGVDLHVHTPASADMDPDQAANTPIEVVQAILAAGLDLVAVTDHNTAAWCDDMREAASGLGVTVLPGAEISTNDGHLLAVFDADCSGDSISDLLTQIGIPRAEQGSLTALAKFGMDEVATKVREAGGIAIAAHVDTVKGLWVVGESVPIRRQQLHACPDIAAYEIVDASRRLELGGGRAGYERPVPVIQGSDSWPEGGDHHRIEAVGRRRCFMKIDDLSLSGLRQALLDPQLRIALVGDAIKNPDARIEGMTFSAGFLTDEGIRFNPGVNCLVGGTGSGKSLSLELLRFALAQRVDPGSLPKIAEETSSLLEFGLGEGGTVRVAVSKGQQTFVVERTWMGASSPDPVVLTLAAGGVLEPTPAPVHVPSFFPIKAFSQGEVIEFARDRSVRLSLIDDLLDLDFERSEIDRVKSELRGSASELLKAERHRQAQLQKVKELPGLALEIGRLTSFLGDDRVKQHESWYLEKDIIEQAEDALEGLAEQTEEALRAHTVVLVEGASPEATPNPEVFEDLLSVERAVNDAIEKAASSLVTTLGVQQVALRKAAEEWREKFERTEREYAEFLAKEGGLGKQQLVEKLVKAQQRERRLAKIEREIADVIEPGLEELEQRRSKLLTDLGSLRRRIREKREEKAVTLTERLNKKVKIDIHERGIRSGFEALLASIAQGSYIRDDTIHAMAETLHPMKLVSSLLSGDFDTPANLAGIDSALTEKIMETIRDKGREAGLYELQIVDAEDAVRIAFDVGGEYRRLEDLAHGQKCTVVLMVALAEGEVPFVVDQPEDALHAPWIEDYIVDYLRTQRGTRQCLFATRSAGVMVSADAEQIVGLDATAHAGKVTRTGSIDRFDTRDLVVYHVEGGREAFLRRKAKYGF